MTITRGFAAGAMLAGLALVVMAPVSTADPLNGHYIETETYPDGHQVHTDWFVTPCGDGCASIKELGQANLAPSLGRLLKRGRKVRLSMPAWRGMVTFKRSSEQPRS